MYRALDKNLTKTIAARCGLPTPDWLFFSDADEVFRADSDAFPLPAVVKPNFESSSLGITADSYVTRPEQARVQAVRLLAQHPYGVLVERYVPGRDITVPYLEAVKDGALTPAEHVLLSGTEPGSMFDFARKAAPGEHIRLDVPAKVDDGIGDRARTMTVTAVHALGLRDLARADFRLASDGALYLLEVNSLPTLTPGGVMHKAAALAGLDPVHGVLDAVLTSAHARHDDGRLMPSRP
nr:hypothetical protein [Streptomyces sp. CBMA152]